MTQTTCQIRVRYAETDSMGVVYYGNYLTWFEVGRTDLLRQLGHSYREIEETEGIRLPVIEARCRYHKPARYDDLVDILTRASRPSRLQLQFDYELSRAEDGTLLASGSTLHVAVGRNGKPRRLPLKLEGLLT
ncbi:MAG TPA: thioesterase family protein [Vicinamibacteria bacterium]